MIKYIHTSYVASGLNQRKIVKVYDEPNRAYEEQMLCGGEVQEVIDVAALEAIKDLVVDEVACLIDDFSTDAPGSARSLEPGSSEWDIYKLAALNNLRDILDGKFNENA